jgi:hypothetical protein
MQWHFAAFSVHGALSDHHRLIRQFGADPLMYYLDGENVIIKTTESDPHASVPLQPQQNHLKTTSRWTDERT